MSFLTTGGSRVASNGNLLDWLLYRSALRLG